MGTAVMLLLTPFLVASGLPRMSASLLLGESPRPTPGAPQDLAESGGLAVDILLPVAC